MEALIGLAAVFFVIGVPVMSLAARFVVRPLIKDISEAIRGKGTSRVEELERRLVRMEEALLDQDRLLARLSEAERFRRQLESGRRGIYGEPSFAAARTELE